MWPHRARSFPSTIYSSWVQKDQLLLAARDGGVEMTRISRWANGHYEMVQ